MNFDALALKAIKEQCKENRMMKEKESYSVFHTLTVPKGSKIVMRKLINRM